MDSILVEYECALFKDVLGCARILCAECCEVVQRRLDAHREPGRVFDLVAMARSTDTLRIDELVLTLPFAGDDGDDTQAVLLSLSIVHDIARAARSDDLAYSINYAAVYATLVDILPKTHYASLEAFVDHVFETLFGSHPDVHKASVVVTLRDASPRATIETTRRRDQTSKNPYRCIINKLAFSTIIGVNPRERTETQPVVLDITVDRQHRVQDCFPFKTLSTSIYQVIHDCHPHCRRGANDKWILDIHCLDVPYGRGTRVGSCMSRSRVYQRLGRQGDD